MLQLNMASQGAISHLSLRGQSVITLAWRQQSDGLHRDKLVTFTCANVQLCA